MFVTVGHKFDFVFSFMPVIICKEIAPLQYFTSIAKLQKDKAN